jgi:hypothetical protein
MAEKRLTSTRKAVVAHVTQAIIDRAEAKNSNTCMIADAIRAARPDLKAISVDMATIRFTDPVKRQRYVYLTPQRAQLALIEFDQGVATGPFDVRLVGPVQVVEITGKTPQPDGTTKRPSEAHRGIVQVAGGTGRPVRLGGRLPPKDELNMGGAGKTNPKISAAEKRAVAAREVREAAEAAEQATAERAAAEQRAKAALAAKKLRATKPAVMAEIRAEAERVAADRAKGGPPTEASNITMEQTNRKRRHIREFGLKQLVK